FRRFLEALVNLRVMQQHFCGNAADVQASPPQERIFFHNDGFQPKLPRTDGGDITAGTAADNCHVVLCHSLSPFRAPRAFQGDGDGTAKSDRSEWVWPGWAASAFPAHPRAR